MKKRILAAMIASALMISAAACGNNEKKPDATTAAPKTSAADNANSGSTEKTYKPAADIAAAVLAEMPINSAKDKDREKLEDYFDGLDINTIVDSQFYICASGSSPDELGIFRFDSEASAKAAVTSIMDRLIERKKTCEDYPIMKEEMYKFDDAAVVQEGVWVYYIVTSNNAKAEEIIKGAIG